MRKIIARTYAIRGPLKSALAAFELKKIAICATGEVTALSPRAAYPQRSGKITARNCFARNFRHVVILACAHARM